MAKDGTNRGGARPGAGRSKKPLQGRIQEGYTWKTNVMNSPGAEDFGMNDDYGFENFDSHAVDIPGADMPPPDEYLSAKQKDGRVFGADKIYMETWQWLKERKCEKFVNKRLIESYAQTFARYIQCEAAISTFGFIGKHPTTGGMISSPFVAMSQSFQKHANMLWYQIFQIVRENCAVSLSDDLNDDPMARLLSQQRRR